MPRAVGREAQGEKARKKTTPTHGGILTTALLRRTHLGSGVKVGPPSALAKARARAKAPVTRVPAAAKVMPAKVPVTQDGEARTELLAENGGRLMSYHHWPAG